MLSTTVWSCLTSGVYLSVYYAILLGLSCCALGYLSDHSNELRTWLVFGLLWSWPLLAFPLVLLYSWISLWRERRWLERLPFAVEGHLQALGSRFLISDVKIWFAESRPPFSTIRDSLSRSYSEYVRPGEELQSGGGAPSKSRVRDLMVIECSWSSLWWFNYGYRRWFHRLVEKELKPVHLAYPIERIRTD